MSDEKAATVKVVNASQCRRELVLDTQTYADKDGKFLYDINGRSMQPMLKSIMLEQGANAVDESFLARVRAAHPHIEALFKRGILKVAKIAAPTIGVKDLKGIEPVDVDDLSMLTEDAARKIIKVCEDHQLLRKWVDSEHRQTVRTMLRERFAEVVPRDESGVEATESLS